jgi:hypothetical protein
MNLRFAIYDLRLIQKTRPAPKSQVASRKLQMSRGFSFAEILFAVIILGIGFIMVAMIFPVAIQEAKNTTDESLGAAMVQGSIGYLSQAMVDGTGGASTSNCPPVLNSSNTATIVQNPSDAAVSPPLWTSIRGNLIQTDDPRYGWVFVYRRDENTAVVPPVLSPVAQVFIFPVEARATQTFTSVDTTIPAGVNTFANLMARQVQIAVADNVASAGGADLIAFDNRSAVPTYKRNAIAAAIENAFVIVGDDKLNNSPAGTAGRMNGRIFKLGARRTDLDGAGAIFGDSSWTSAADMVVYELSPTNEFTRDPGVNGQLYNSTTNAGDNDDIAAIGNQSPVSNSSVTSTATADAFLIGRGYAQGSATAYDGAAMPIGTYFSTLVKVNQ